MKYTDVVSNVNVYGMESAVMGSKYPMAVDLTKVDGTIVPRTHALANAKPGSGHDNFLNGIIVQFDLTFTNKAWVEAERYHFLDFISSQSTMHRITKFNLDEVYISYTDPRIIEIMKEKVNSYNELTQKISDKKLAGEDITELNEEAKVKYLEILYSNPAGCRITARMTTNYRQLKPIYAQRKTHRLPEWRAFCDWVETLPNASFIVNNDVK